MSTSKSRKSGNASHSAGGYLYQIAGMFYLMTASSEILSRYGITITPHEMMQEGDGEDINIRDTFHTEINIQIKHYSENLTASNLKIPYLDRVLDSKNKNYLFAPKLSSTCFLENGQIKYAGKNAEIKSKINVINSKELLICREIPSWIQLVSDIKHNLKQKHLRDERETINMFLQIFYELCNYFFTPGGWKNIEEFLKIDTTLIDEVTLKENFYKLIENKASSVAKYSLKHEINNIFEMLHGSAFVTPLSIFGLGENFAALVNSKPASYWDIIENFNKLMKFQTEPRNEELPKLINEERHSLSN